MDTQTYAVKVDFPGRPKYVARVVKVQIGGEMGSSFEDIRKIIAIKLGFSPEEVRVLALQLKD